MLKYRFLVIGFSFLVSRCKMQGASVGGSLPVSISCPVTLLASLPVEKNAS